jgi:hypothetical protein
VQHRLIPLRLEVFDSKSIMEAQNDWCYLDSLNYLTDQNILSYQEEKIEWWQSSIK